MTPISDALKDLLGRQGLTAREGLAGPVARGMKERGAASDGARSQLRQREDAADLNSERDRGNVTPAKFTDLRLVSSRDVRRQNPASVAPLGLRTSLMLVWSQ